MLKHGWFDCRLQKGFWALEARFSTHNFNQVSIQDRYSQDILPLLLVGIMPRSKLQNWKLLVKVPSINQQSHQPVPSLPDCALQRSDRSEACKIFPVLSKHCIPNWHIHLDAMNKALLVQVSGNTLIKASISTLAMYQSPYGTKCFPLFKWSTQDWPPLRLNDL